MFSGREDQQQSPSEFSGVVRRDRRKGTGRRIVPGNICPDPWVTHLLSSSVLLRHGRSPELQGCMSLFGPLGSSINWDVSPACTLLWCEHPSKAFAGFHRALDLFEASLEASLTPRAVLGWGVQDRAWCALGKALHLSSPHPFELNSALFFPKVSSQEQLPLPAFPSGLCCRVFRANSLPDHGLSSENPSPNTCFST